MENIIELNNRLAEKNVECEKLKAINMAYIRIMDEYRVQSDEMKSDYNRLCQALDILRKANRVLRIAFKNQFKQTVR